MKKLFAIVSALLVITGIKAQKPTVHKETVKPAADTNVKKSANTQLNKTAAQQKEVKITPAIKYSPAAKLTPEAEKLQKQTPVKQ